MVSHYAHRYYFLKEIEPRRSGRDLVRTPEFMYVHVAVVTCFTSSHSKRLLLRYRVGTVPVQEVRMANPSAAGFRAFSGQGRRLAD